MTACLFLEDEWYIHFLVAVGTFFGGLLILVPSRLLWYCCFSVDDENAFRKRNSGYWRAFSRMRSWAVNATTAQTMLGKFTIVFVFVCNLASIVIYLLDATYHSHRDCGTVRRDPRQLVYAGLCCVFAVNYFLRFIAATDKLYLWVDIYSVVDHLTIGPFFYSLVADENWISMKFLRILYILQLSEILQMTHTLKSSSAIRLAQIVTIFVGVWFTSAGIAQVIETSAPMAPGRDDRSILGYWEAVYWLLVTMSTVGFGEIVPQTNLGRAFIVIYIIGTFAMFTAIVPELIRHVGRRSRFKNPYKRIYGKRHVIVCGNITYDTISRFIRDFIHKDAENRNINVVFIDHQKPNLEMEAFFKRHYDAITFIQGSVMDMHTLRNAKLRDAEACLILANRHCSDPDEEDGANIMRATALKNYHADCRVIIQLLQYHNKTYLLHIPNWNWDRTNGDDVICIAELKLGLMAQNCLARGVCCLMANLFTMRSYKSTRSGSWQDDYRYGAGNEIYIQTFSSAFVGLSFAQAAEICFTELGVLLVAIQSDAAKARGRIRVNPQSKATINLGMRGFFIAQGPEEVRRVRNYKPTRGGMADANDNRVNNSGSMKMQFLHPNMAASDEVSIDAEHEEYLENIGSRLASYKPFIIGSPTVSLQKGESLIEGALNIIVKRTPDSQNRRANVGPSSGYQARRRNAVRVKIIDIGHRKPSLDPVRMRAGSKDTTEIFDYTGMFHWCPTRELDDAIVDFSKAASLKLRDHVVVCLLSDSTCPLIGLTNFVMPLRTSNFVTEDLKDIIVLGNPDYIKKEWDALANFPRIYIFNGSPSHRPDLRAVEAEKACMCVIMSAKRHIIVDTTMLDKEAILTNLNVQGMFSKDTEEKIRSLGLVTTEEELDPNNPNTMAEVPITTELEIENNVAFLDQDDEDDPDLPLYMTHPYVSGTALASSCLDSLLAATFQNSHILTLVRALITGGEAAELERILGDGLGIVRRTSPLDQHYARERCRLVLLPLGKGPLSHLQGASNYGRLMVEALRSQNILCLGLYRLMKTQGLKLARANKRFVITNPPKDFTILPSDMVYALQPSSQFTETMSGGTGQPRTSPAFPMDTTLEEDDPTATHL